MEACECHDAAARLARQDRRPWRSILLDQRAMPALRADEQAR
jgi:hypothetical protein